MQKNSPKSLCDVAIAEILFDHAKRFPERSEVIDRFAERALFRDVSIGLDSSTPRATESLQNLLIRQLGILSPVQLDVDGPFEGLF